MPIPTRGEVWLADLGYAAKVRPVLVLSVQIEIEERALTTVIPHTTSVRGTRFESPTQVSWLKNGAFDAQGIGTYPTVKLIKLLGTLPHEQLKLVEECVLIWLGICNTNSGS